MKLTLILGIFFSVVCTLSQEKVKWVYDEIGLLSVEDSLAIDSALTQLNKNNISMGVYITDVVDNKNGDAEKAAQRLGKTIGWGEGSGENGAILYIAMVDQKVCLAFDDGLGFTDDQVQNVTDIVINHFKNRQYKEGVMQAIKQMELLVSIK